MLCESRPKPCTRRHSKTIRASRREGERARAPEERARTKMRTHARMHSILQYLAMRLLARPAPKNRSYAPSTPPLNAQAFLTPSLASLGKIAPATRVKCDASSPRMRRPSAGMPHLRTSTPRPQQRCMGHQHRPVQPCNRLSRARLPTSDRKACCCCCLPLSLSLSLSLSSLSPSLPPSLPPSPPPPLSLSIFRAALKMGLFDSLTKGMEAMIGATAQF
jgi:hypothetical protein